VTDDPSAVLLEACRAVGLDATHAELIRAGENTLYRLPGRIVARVTREGQAVAAAKEVCVSRWLMAVGVPVVEALADIDQPAEVERRAVTFWRELPPHRRGNLAELADILRQLHALPAPDFELPPLAPFVRQITGSRVCGASMERGLGDGRACRNFASTKPLNVPSV
jgi:hypothetical protein